MRSGAVELVYDHYKQIMENAKDPLFRGTGGRL